MESKVKRAVEKPYTSNTKGDFFMSQQKTEFKFKVNADATLVEAVIRNWLVVNKFAPNPKYGANVYEFNDPMLKGRRGFEYYINGNEVTILAYIGKYEKPQALEGFVGAVMKQDYRNEMAPLFDELKKLENASATQQTVGAAQPADPQQTSEAAQPTGAQPQSVSGTQQQSAGAYQTTGTAPVQNDSLNTFMEQNNKKQETLVIVGFVMSLIGLLLSCFGATYGVILIMLEFYFAIQGLKTKKKGLAIATIVLASLGICMYLLSIVVYVLFA